MEIPEGENISDETRRTKVCKLQKALYGLRISPKRQNEKFTEVAKSLGLENDDTDPCLFTWSSGITILLLLIYVDDILVAGNNEEKLKEDETHLMKSFELTDLGEPENFLRMEITIN